MFQAEALMPWRTAIDNVSAGLQFKGVPEKERHEQARHWLSRVGLSGFEDRYPHELSGGMRKRVALAQTLIMDPDIILMDEPFSALDIQTRQLMENEVLALWSQKKKAVLFITHDLDEAISISDRVVVFSAGPGSHPIGEFYIDIARPRDVAEVRVTPRFIELHNAIWADLREEVLKGYENQRKQGEVKNEKRKHTYSSVKNEVSHLPAASAGCDFLLLVADDQARPHSSVHVPGRESGSVLLR